MCIGVKLKLSFFTVSQYFLSISSLSVYLPNITDENFINKHRFILVGKRVIEFSQGVNQATSNHLILSLLTRDFNLSLMCSLSH